MSALNRKSAPPAKQSIVSPPGLSGKPVASKPTKVVDTSPIMTGPVTQPELERHVTVIEKCLSGAMNGLAGLPDALTELDRLLSIVTRDVLHRVSTRIETALLDRAMLHAGSLLLRELLAICVVKFYSLDSSSVDRSYKVCMAHMNGEAVPIESATAAADAKAAAAAAAASTSSAVVEHKESVRVGATCVFGALAVRFGQQFIVSMTDVVNTLCKLTKHAEVCVREIALIALKQICEATGGPPRNDSVFADMLKSIGRATKDKSPRVARVAADCFLASVMHSPDFRELDTVLNDYAFKCLADPNVHVRYAFAHMIGSALALAACKKPSDKPLEKPKRDAVTASVSGLFGKVAFTVTSIEEALSHIERLFVKCNNGLIRAGLTAVLIRLLRNSQSVITPTNLPVLMQTILSWIEKGKKDWDERDRRHVAKCVAIALREGLLLTQKEKGLEIACKVFTETLSAFLPQRSKPAAAANASASGSASPPPVAVTNEYQVFVALHELGFVLSQIGAAVEETDIKDPTSNALLQLISHPREWIRVHAAQCLRQFSLAAPSHTATWIRFLSNVMVIHLSELLESQTEHESANQTFFSLHGHVQALAALVGIVPALECGVPLPLLDSAFDQAKKLIELPVIASEHTNEEHAFHRKSLREAGWLLIASLIGLGSEFVSSRLNVLFTLWKNCLNTKPVNFGDWEKTGDAYIILEIRIRTASLIALRCLVHVYRETMTVTATQFSPALKPAAAFLVNTFNLIKKMPQPTPTKQISLGVTSATCALKSILMDLFAVLPASTYSASFTQLLQAVVTEFTTRNPPPGTDLQRSVNVDDQSLESTTVAMPHIKRFHDLGQRELAVFVNYSYEWLNFSTSLYSTPLSYALSISPLAPAPTTATAAAPAAAMYQPFCALAAVATPTIQSFALRQKLNAAAASACPTAESAVVNSGSGTIDSVDAVDNSLDLNDGAQLRAINACIRVFASIFPDQNPHHKEQLMTHFLALITKAKARNALDSGTCMNISAALLAVARVLTARNTVVGAPKSLDAIVAIAMELLASPTYVARRSASEAIGLFARLEGDGFTNQVMKNLEKKLDVKLDAEVAQSAALMLGCLFRAVGPARMSAHFPFTIAILQLLSRDVTEPFRLWILHSLALALEGAHPQAAHVGTILSILSSHTLHDIALRNPTVTQCIARCIHALMSVMGPELSKPNATSNTSVQRFLTLWHHVRRDTNSLVQVEVLRIISAFITHCPTAIDRATMLPLVTQAITSDDLGLRRGGLRTLKGWCQRDPWLIVQSNLDQLILTGIDNEMNDGVRIEWEMLFETFITLLVPLPPPPTAATASATASAAATAAATALAVAASASATTGLTKQQQLAARQAAEKAAALAALAAANEARTKKGGDDSKEAAGGPNWRRLLRASMGLVVGLAQLESGTGRDEKESGGGGGSASGAGGADEDDSEGINQKAAARGAVTRTIESRSRTKIFAIHCVDMIVAAVKALPDSHDFDFAYAKKHDSASKQNFLVFFVPDLIRVACLACSAASDASQVTGMRLLHRIISCFGDCADMNQSLLSLHGEASINSTLRQALILKTESRDKSAGSGGGTERAISPQLRLIACDVVIPFLLSGISNDDGACRKVFECLLTPLERHEQVSGWLSQFEDRIRTVILLAHLSVIAALQLHGAVLNEHKASGAAPKLPKHQNKSLSIVTSLIQQKSSFMAQQYLSCVKDYLVVSTQSARNVHSLAGYYFDGRVVTGIRGVYEHDWTSILRATKERANEWIATSSATVLVCSAVLHRTSAFVDRYALRKPTALSAAATLPADPKDQMALSACLTALTSVLRTSAGVITYAQLSYDYLLELIAVFDWCLDSRTNILFPAARRAAFDAISALIDSLAASGVDHYLSRDAAARPLVYVPPTGVPPSPAPTPNGGSKNNSSPSTPSAAATAAAAAAVPTTPASLRSPAGSSSSSTSGVSQTIQNAQIVPPRPNPSLRVSVLHRLAESAVGNIFTHLPVKSASTLLDAKIESQPEAVLSPSDSNVVSQCLSALCRLCRVGISAGASASGSGSLQAAMDEWSAEEKDHALQQQKTGAGASAGAGGASSSGDDTKGSLSLLDVKFDSAPSAPAAASASASASAAIEIVPIAVRACVHVMRSGDLSLTQTAFQSLCDVARIPVPPTPEAAPVWVALSEIIDSIAEQLIAYSAELVSGNRSAAAGINGARTKCLLAGLLMLGLTHGSSAGGAASNTAGSAAAAPHAVVSAHIIWKAIDTVQVFMRHSDSAVMRGYAFDAIRSTAGNPALVSPQSQSLLALFVAQFTAPLIAAVRYPLAWPTDGQAASSCLVSLYGALHTSANPAIAATADRLLSLLLPLFISALAEHDTALGPVMQLAQSAGQRFRDRVAALPTELQTQFSSSVVKSQSQAAAAPQPAASASRAKK